MQLELGGIGGSIPREPGSPLPARETMAAWRTALPEMVRFGTSTWTYPGWLGLVYSSEYPAQGASARMLAEYARFPLFSTVGIDSSFYGPPRPGTLAAWARVLPEGFRCVSKVWDRITVHTFTGRREAPELAGRVNADFLNPNLFVNEVYEPFRVHFGEHTGPFVFEFQQIAGRRETAEWFGEQLDGFLGLLPRDGEYAVEVRNPEYLTPAYFAVLREHGVAHVFNSWTRMPPIGAQLALDGAVTAGFVVARALLRPGRTYAEAVELFKPYDRIRDPSPELRQDLATLARTAIAQRIPAWLIVNNRAEGSAPHTIAEVVRELVDG